MSLLWPSLPRHCWIGAQPTESSGGAAEPGAERNLSLDWAGREAPSPRRRNQQHQDLQHLSAPRRALLKFHYRRAQISSSQPFFSVFPSFFKLSKDMLEIKYSWGLLILRWKDRLYPFKKTLGKWSPTICGNRVSKKITFISRNLIKLFTYVEFKMCLDFQH